MTPDPIPCSAFTRGLHIFGPLKWDTAQISQEISVWVRNTSCHAYRFMSTVFGKTPSYASFPTRSFPQGSFVPFVKPGTMTHDGDGNPVVVSFGEAAAGPGGRR